MEESVWVCITALLTIGLLASLAAHCYRNPSRTSAGDLEAPEAPPTHSKRRGRHKARVVPAIIRTTGYDKDTPLLGSAGSSAEMQYLSSPSTSTIISTNRPIPSTSQPNLNASGFSMTFHTENTLDQDSYGTSSSVSSDGSGSSVLHATDTPRVKHKF